MTFFNYEKPLQTASLKFGQHLQHFAKVRELFAAAAQQNGLNGLSVIPVEDQSFTVRFLGREWHVAMSFNEKDLRSTITAYRVKKMPELRPDYEPLPITLTMSSGGVITHEKTNMADTNDKDSTFGAVLCLLELVSVDYVKGNY